MRQLVFAILIPVLLGYAAPIARADAAPMADAGCELLAPGSAARLACDQLGCASIAKSFPVAAYVCSYGCTVQKRVGCASNPVITRGDGRTVSPPDVFRFQNADSADNLVPHMLLPYLTALEGVLLNGGYSIGASCSAKAQGQSTGLKREALRALDTLDAQIDFMHTQAPRIQSRNGHLVFETRGSDLDPSHGYTHAMVQAEYAKFLFELSRIVNCIDPDRAAIYVEYALQMDSALDEPAGPGTGGASSALVSCGPKHARKDCLWLYSRAGVAKQEPGTALNQAFHAIRDSIDMMRMLTKPKGNPFPLSFASKKRNERAAEIRKRVVGALYYLAYSDGIESIPQAPSLKDFMDDHGGYYWAYYDASGVMGSAALQMNRIDGTSLCHYHAHALEVFSEILDRLDAMPDLRHEVQPAIDLIMHYSTHNKGKVEPMGVEIGADPIYQLLLSEIVPGIKYGKMGCPAPAKSSDCLSRDGLGTYLRYYPDMSRYLQRSSRKWSTECLLQVPAGT